MTFKKIYPFSAIVGQDNLKLVLMLNAVNPKIGGVLIRGEKGTAKSTAVRALAALLPEKKIIENCPIGCDPDDKLHPCPWCRKIEKEKRKIRNRKIEVVTLPLNATEDRVAGCIDFSAAIKKGKRTLLPGLLARAHRSILYVDEVNLLDDHIVDIILDAAASGENRIEREGISFKHPASFILVGTMNPEEGDLRPQFLDRFGLCIEVKAEKEMENRVLLMQRREAFDLNPKKFLKKFEKENFIISQQIISAAKLINSVVIPKFLRSFISELCIKNAVAGHRADLIMEQAAKAHAALQGRIKINTDDITKIAAFVLMHRIRDAVPPSDENQFDKNRPDENLSNENLSDESLSDENLSDENRSDTDDDPLEKNPQGDKDRNTDKGGNRQVNNQHTQKTTDNSENQKLPFDISREMQSSDYQGNNLSSDKKIPVNEQSCAEKIFKTGLTFGVKKITSKKDRIFRRGSGRRSRTLISLKQGRYIKSTLQNGNADIALDATLRAAACHQNSKAENQTGLAVVIRKEDIREKIREKRIGNFLLFVVDASGSMGARGRMAASKGAIMSLLLDAYQKRDRVSMVSFRKNQAVVNLPPTSSVELAGKLLAQMPVGGRTPLSAALVTIHEQVRNYLLRDAAARPIVILITDGKTNVAIKKNTNPVDEALNFAVKISADKRISFIVVDTEETGPVNFKLAARLAGALNAQYFKIENLKADQLTDIVNNVDT